MGEHGEPFLHPRERQTERENDVDNIFASLLTGNDHYTAPNSVKDAIAERATVLIPGIEQKHPEGRDACYDGNRCKPENLGWRFEQGYGSPEPQEILDGKWDEQITETYHESASAEHWYRFEKDWS